MTPVEYQDSYTTEIITQKVISTKSSSPFDTIDKRIIGKLFVAIQTTLNRSSYISDFGIPVLAK